MLVHGPGAMSLQLAGVRLCLKPRACHLPHQMQSKQAQRSWFCVLLAANGWGCQCKTRSQIGPCFQLGKLLLASWITSKYDVISAAAATTHAEHHC